MKLIPCLLISCLGLCGSVFSQSSFEIDPAEALTDFTSLAEWEIDGDFQGWEVNHLPDATVSSGILSGTTNGGDTQIVLNPLAPTISVPALGEMIVEVRVKRAAADASVFELFWADGNGGFAAARSVNIPAVSFPADEALHVLRLRLGTVKTSLNALRIDTTKESGSAIELDYVRVKVVPFIDPPQKLNLYTSLAEFHTSGDLEGWTGANVNGITVTNGILSGETVGGDPQLRKFTGISLDSTSGEFPTVEIRMRRPAVDTSRVDLFWADGAGGIAAERKFTIDANAWPNDGQFHVFHANLGALFTGTITGFRLDPVADGAVARQVDVDYIRIGRVATDTDSDGLADLAETNSSFFVDSRDTGSNPNNAFSDADAFSDGVEVSFGTDPNDALSFPEPVFSGYSTAPAKYLRNAVAANNTPIVINGTANGFSVAPGLPNGLMLNTTNGVISGTPDTASVAADYTVTADFGGGVTRDFILNLEVADPAIISYTVPSPSYIINAVIATNSPVLFGPVPDSFTISAPLPDGLIFDTFTGTISGIPTSASPQAAYLITGNYSASPAASYSLLLRVKNVPVFLGSDKTPISASASFAEWDTDGNDDGWAFANATGLTSNGTLEISSTALDPQMSKGALGYDPAGGVILEIRVRQSDSEEITIFWGDGSGNGAAAGRSIVIPSGQVIGDGQFHTYQVSFDDALVGNLLFLRIDPGTNPNRTAEFDYIRIGVAGEAAPAKITAITYDKDFQEASIIFNSASGVNYTVETSTDLRTWTPITPDFVGDPGSTTVIDPSASPAKFYRVREANP